MKKNFLILITSLVLISFFKTSEVNFSLLDKPNLNTECIQVPDIPIVLDMDVSLFGIFINFFYDLELDYSVNKIVEFDNVFPVIPEIVSEKHNNYSVQFSASDTYIKSFSGIDDFNVYEERGIIHYTVGSFPSLSLAEEKMHSIRLLGFSDAFVFTFNDDERICYFVVEKENTDKNNISFKQIVEADVEDFFISPSPPDVVEIIENIPQVEDVVYPEKIAVAKKVVVVKNIPSIEEVVVKTETNVVVNSAINKGDDDGYPIKTDEEIIQDSPYIKENAKELIIKSLKNKIISIEDIEKLLSEYSGEIIKKKYVKKLIKSK